MASSSDIFLPATTSNQGPENIGNAGTTGTASSGAIGSANTNATYPTIVITTVKKEDSANACSIIFEYLPDSLSFATTANFTPTPIPFTSARMLFYVNSDLNEVSLSVRVVAGCNNAITMISSNTSTSGFTARGGAVATKTVRNGIMKVAKLLYSLTLPATNDLNGNPPPTCNLTVGPFSPQSALLPG